MTEREKIAEYMRRIEKEAKETAPKLAGAKPLGVAEGLLYLLPLVFLVWVFFMIGVKTSW